MSKIAAPARPAHPSTTRSWCDWLAADLVPVAARAAADIRDLDPADVRQALTEVPPERRDDLILLLAAMVDPDRSLAELLAWTVGTVRSRDGATERRTFTGDYVPCPDCGKRTRFDNLLAHRGGRQCHPPAKRAEKQPAKRPVDAVAVDERAAGRAVKLTTAELDAVVADLTDRGLSSEDIAQRLRVTRRTVVRSRARIRDQADRLDRLIDAGVNADAATVLAARQRVA